MATTQASRRDGVSGRGAAASRRRTGTGAALVLAGAFFVLLGVLALLERLHPALVGGYLVLSVVTLLLYRKDKAAAVRGSWRTPESTLHLVALLGGWPGALVASRAFRHKTTKQPFVTVRWLTVVVNCAALAWFVAVGGVDALT